MEGGAAFDRTTVIVVVAIATFVVPILFLGLVGVAWRRRNRGSPVGSRLEGALALVAGASLGTMVLMTVSDLIVGLPLVVVAVLVIVDRFRRSRRVQAGVFIAGLALPWTVLWGFYTLLLVSGAVSFVPEVTWGGFLAGSLIVGVGVVLASRGDPPTPAPDPGAAPGQPGSRQIGTISAAILEPTRVGPFRLPEVAALVAIVVTWTVIGLIPFPDRIIGLAVAVVVTAFVATEAHVRSFPTHSRKAFEAFSWLGEWEFAQVRAQTGGPVPTTRRAADAWLARHPDTPELAWIRAEVLVLAGQPEAAAAVVERMPARTPEERFARASTSDLVDWARGGEGGLAAMEDLLEDVGPAGSEERLRAEVAIAASKVRLAMEPGMPADGPARVLEPLVAVRERLGRRADGQIGRALRKRLIPAYLLFGLIFGLAAEIILGPVGWPAP